MNFGICVWRTAAQWQNPRKKTCFDVGKIGFCHCAAVLKTQEPKRCTDLDFGLLYILVLETYSKFARKKKFPSARRLLSAALLERWPQVCRVKITCTKLPTTRNSFVSTTKTSIKWVVNWIPLRIRVRSRNTQPQFDVDNVKSSRTFSSLRPLAVTCCP